MSSVSQNLIPAAAITLATGTGEIQPIILGTKPCKSTDEDDIASPWVIKNLKVSLLRNWDTSIAKVVLACDLDKSNMQIPALPNVYKYRKGRYPYLTSEDEIRIYAGNLPPDRVDTPIVADDLTEYQLNPQGQLEKTNPKGSLFPIFWGFIDKEEQDISEKGIFRTLSCRDRMRVFQDTNLISLDINPEVKTDKPEELLTGDRIQLLMKIANSITGDAVGGDLNTESKICWRKIIQGLSVKGYGVDDSNKNQYVRTGSINQTGVEVVGLGKADVITNPSLWLRAASFLAPIKGGQPRFHIWAERPPVTKGFSEGVLQVLDKSPTQIINHLALTEERPIDFFASHANGDYVFGPRVADFTGLEDEARLYRTYYCLPPEEDAVVGLNQAITFKGVSSTLATYNRFIVLDSGVSRRNSSMLKQTTLALEQYPFGLLDRDPMPPCRVQIIQDATLDSWGNRNGAAMIVGLNAARRWSRDINVVQMKIIGDPTWYPGEIFQLYNTGIHDRGIVVNYDEAKTEAAHQQAMKLAESDEIEAALERDEKKRKETKQVTTTPEIQAILLKLQGNLGKSTTEITDDLSSVSLPRYIARSIVHEFSEKGFFTTVQGSADY